MSHWGRSTRASAACEQCVCDASPFLVERSARDGLRRPAIPVGRVASVALLAMKVGVDPGAVAAVVILRDLMRAVPIAAGFEQESAEQGGQVSRRLAASCGSQ